MNIESELEIRKKAVLLVRLIQDEMCINPRSLGKMRMPCKFDSTIFMKKVADVLGESIPEIEWVKILKFLRERDKFRSFYEQALLVPFEHDGGSGMHFPEVYDGPGKLLVKLNTDINDLESFYPEIPGIEDRSWKEGDMVYVPEDRAQRYVKFNWMEVVKP